MKEDKERRVNPIMWVTVGLLSFYIGHCVGKIINILVSLLK